MSPDDAAAALTRLREEMTAAVNALLPGLPPQKALAAGVLHGGALKALGATEAGLRFHEPVQLHELAFDLRGNPRCAHDPGSDPDAHYEGDDGEWRCESLPAGTACSGCPESPDGEYADWPCDEYEAILTALTGKEADDGR